jgi:hypothetical protein
MLNKFMLQKLFLNFKQAYGTPLKKLLPAHYFFSTVYIKIYNRE